MDAIHSLQPLYSMTGFAVGLLVGMTGVGGGSLMTPLLILLFGIHPATAVGTDLLYAAVTKTAGSAVHGFNRTIDWRIVRLLATGSVPMTVITIIALSHIGINSPAARDLITVVLTIALFVTGGLTTTLPKQMWDDALLKVSPVLAAVSTVLIVFVAVTISLAERLRQGAARA